MAVTIEDTRLVINEADDVTGWNTGTAGSQVFAEAPNSIISTLNIATGQIFFTDGTARDVSDTLIYIWSNNFALQGLWDAAQPPNALFIGDGTNQVSFKMAGINRKVFAHLSVPSTGVFVDWDCLLLDGAEASRLNSEGLAVVRAGSFAALDLTNITQFGSDFTTLSKGLGGGTNVAVDVIRIGNDGLIITDGTISDPGIFSEIVAADQSSSDGLAYGIIRELTTGVYGCQGPLNFGSLFTGSPPGFSPGEDSYFQDSGIVLSFEARDVADDKYYINVMGHPTNSNVFILTNSTITTAGPFVRCNFDGRNLDTLTINEVSFVNLGNTITFSNGPDATGHSVRNSSFNACGQVDPGTVIFTGNTIANSTDGATGSLLIDSDGTDNMSNLSFVSDITGSPPIGSPPNGGHAIYITDPGTYSFINFTYEGFADTDGNTGDEVVYNNSGGAVTINVSGGDTPTVRNGPGATTTVVSSVTVTVTVLDEDSQPIQNAQTAIYRTSDNFEIMNEDTNASGIATEAFGGAVPVAVSVRVRKSSPGETRYIPVNSSQTISSSGLTVTITLAEDPVAV